MNNMDITSRRKRNLTTTIDFLHSKKQKILDSLNMQQVNLFYSYKEKEGKQTICLLNDYCVTPLNQMGEYVESTMAKIMDTMPEEIRQYPGHYNLTKIVHLNTVLDQNEYFKIEDTKLLRIMHGFGLNQYSTYSKETVGFCILVCLKNTGRAYLALNPDHIQLVSGTCIVIRDYNIFTITPQITGSGTYLILRIIATEKFKTEWPNEYKENLESGYKSYSHLKTLDNIEIHRSETILYYRVEFIIYSKILLKELTGKQRVAKRLNNNINCILRDTATKKKLPSFATGIYSESKLFKDKIKEQLRNTLSTVHQLNTTDINSILEVIPFPPDIICTEMVSKDTRSRFFKQVLGKFSDEEEEESINAVFLANLHNIYIQNSRIINHLGLIRSTLSLVLASIQQASGIDITVLDPYITERLQIFETHNSAI